MSNSEVRKRVTFAPFVASSSSSPVSDGSATIDMSGSDKVCLMKQQETTLSLFLKSLKFFTFVFVVGGLMSLLMETITGINRIYLYFVMGLSVSMLATYYKFRVWYDPSYKPDCDCANPEPASLIPTKEDMMDGIFNVLSHKKSAMFLNIPNTVFGILFYSFMIVINAYQLSYVYPITYFFTVVSCTGSLYLWYTMICEIGSVCVICSSIHAISFLTLFSFIF